MCRRAWSPKVCLWISQLATMSDDVQCCKLPSNSDAGEYVTSQAQLVHKDGHASCMLCSCLYVLHNAAQGCPGRAASEVLQQIEAKNAFGYDRVRLSVAVSAILKVAAETLTHMFWHASATCSASFRQSTCVSWCPNSSSWQTVSLVDGVSEVAHLQNWAVIT